MTDPLNCWNGVVGTNHEYGTGNGNEWEYWIPVLWGYTPGSGWAVVSVGNWHYRDSRPNYITGTKNAWLTSPSGATNAFSSWFWTVNSGFWYAVQNWGYADSAGWSSIWAAQLGDTAYPTYCWA